jgi:hypothetical protein
MSAATTLEYRAVAALARVEVEVGRVKHLVTGAGGTVLQDHEFPLPCGHE